MNYKELPYYKNVLRGMAWLDEHYDGWLDKVELGTLDMNSPGADVLYQVGTKGMGMLDQFHGMDAPLDNNILTETWKSLIKLRRDLKPIPDGTVFVGQGPLPKQYQGISPDLYCIITSAETDQWDPASEGVAHCCCYAVKPEHPIVTQWLFEEQKETEMPKKYTIQPDGSVSFAGTLVPEDDIKWLRTCVSKVLPHNEFTAAPMGDIQGHSMTFHASLDSTIRIGCQHITLREFKEFIDDYDSGEWGGWKEPEVFRPGQKFHGPCNSDYILASMGKHYALIGLYDGNYWNGPYEVKNPIAIRLEEVAPANSTKFTPFK